ncbi:MAG: hypothetical protein ACOYX1_11375 [Acidobacteriota bacterium]
MKSIARMIGTLLTGAVLACAQTGTQPEVALRAAMELETVKGDLRGAIQRYATLAEGKDRAVAAKALVRMAQCHEKLGHAEARKIYQRVLREYGDQKEATALARTRLGNTATAAGVKGDRVVWAGNDVLHTGGSVSPDGRLIAYTDWFHAGNLMLHELATGTDRPLTANKNWEGEGLADGAAFSRDGKLVAYGWVNYKPHRAELRIVSVDGAGRPRQVLANEEITNLRVLDWSSDNQLLAVGLARKDRSVQIGVVTVQDGSLRVLKSTSWRGPGKAFFSPDTKYIAYDVPATDTALQRDVFVIAVDGSQDTPVIVNTANDLVMGWSPDGANLLFTSDRTGANGLWLLPVANGKPTAAPRLLKPQIGPVSPLGVTISGGLYLVKDTSTNAIHFAPIDLAAGKLLGPSTAQVYRGTGFSWSPDGKSFAYVTETDGVKVLCIRNTQTGQVRQLPPRMAYIAAPHWSPDSRYLVAGARDFKGTPGLYRFDVETGNVDAVANGGHISRVDVSPDGKKLYYDYPSENRRAYAEKDFATGTVRMVYEPPKPAKAGRYHLSPDGRWAATVLMEGPDPAASVAFKSTSLLLVPIHEGSPRELLRAERPERIEAYANQTWTPDGKALLFVKRTGDRKELWMVLVEGGQARKLDIEVSHWRDEGIKLHPDGKQIAFAAGGQSEEIWTIENLPTDLRARK